MATTLCEMEPRLAVLGPDGTQEFVLPPIRWVPGSLLPKRERVSLTGSAFTALSPPSGAKAVLIDPDTSVSLTIKGITGDTGTVITPSSAPLGIPVILPLGSAPSIGIANGSATAQVVTVWWM